MFPVSIFPDPNVLEYESTLKIGTCFHLILSAKQSESLCPLCGKPSKRVHSHYSRFVADLPVVGCRMMLELKVRKFFCDAVSCPRQIFCERLPEVVQPHGRRTVRLTCALQHLGLLTSAEVSHRIAYKLGIRASPDTLLRVARQYEVIHEASDIRIVGIDDWAKRKGQTYGTIIVDLEQGCPIALLSDRETATLKMWLDAHPDIAFITRDRASCYAEACWQGAPQAKQIADRWHLLKNLFETVECHIAKQYKTIKATLKEKEASEHAEAHEVARPERLSKPNKHQLELQALRHQQRQERFEQIKTLHARGWSKRKISQELGLHRVTVGTYLALEELPDHGNKNRRRSSVLDAFMDYIHQRWNEGCHNAATLFRELRARGYAGSHTTLRSYVQLLREAQGTEVITKFNCSLRPSTKLPSPKTLAWWFMADPERLEPERHALITKLLTHLPELKRDIELVQVGWQMFRERCLETLKPWMDTVKDTGFPELKRFIKGLEQDLRAIENALRYSWSNGPVEGQVNRLKMIKRTMFGRASFDLLSAKVLYRG